MSHDSTSAEGLFNVLLPDAPLTDILTRISTMAARAVPTSAFASITVPKGGSGESPVCTDGRVPIVDQVQYDHDDGPCLRSLRTGQVITVDDMATDSRWPWFSEVAMAQGIRSSVSVPMDVAGNREDVIGALNIFSADPEGFNAETIRALESFAHQAAIVMANARAYWGAVELAEQLQRAMESRATIEQAKGILMAQSRITPDEAFQLLVRASQRENRKLREIAAGIVEHSQARRKP